jgi:hypothetical protein
LSTIPLDKDGLTTVSFYKVARIVKDPKDYPLEPLFCFSIGLEEPKDRFNEEQVKAAHGRYYSVWCPTAAPDYSVGIFTFWFEEQAQEFANSLFKRSRRRVGKWGLAMLRGRGVGDQLPKPHVIANEQKNYILDRFYQNHYFDRGADPMRWRVFDTPYHPADFKHTTRKNIDQSVLFKSFWVDEAWPIECTAEIKPPKERKVSISDLLDMGFTEEVGESYVLETSNMEIYPSELPDFDQAKKIRRKKKRSPWRL